MRTMTYVLHGDPTALARVRVNYHTKRMYDGQEQVKLLSSITIRQQHRDEPYLQGPISISITFFMPMPANWSNKKKSDMVGKFHQIKPDVSNMLKYVEDICNKICFHDDAEISVLERIVKVYDANPRTEFTLMELK